MLLIAHNGKMAYCHFTCADCVFISLYMAYHLRFLTALNGNLSLRAELFETCTPWRISHLRKWWPSLDRFFAQPHSHHCMFFAPPVIHSCKSLCWVCSKISTNYIGYWLKSSCPFSLSLPEFALWSINFPLSSQKCIIHKPMACIRSFSFSGVPCLSILFLSFGFSLLSAS